MKSASIEDAFRDLLPTLESKSLNASSASLGLDAWIAPNTIAGPAVTAETALRVPAVRAAVQLIATSGGTLPLKTFERAADGSKKAAPDHHTYGLVHREANDWLSAVELRTLLGADAAVHGNAFAFLARGGSGRVVEMHRLDPRAVSIRVQDDGSPAYVVTQAKGPPRVLSPVEIMHVAAPGPRGADGFTGLSPIFHAREAIGVALAMEEKVGSIFSKGGRPSGSLTVKGKLDSASHARLKSSWEGAHAGENSGGTAILEDGTEFKQLIFSATDQQFAELRTAQLYEIARAFSVPPSLIAIVDRATWGNSESENRGFLTYTLKPWLAAFKGAYERALLTRDERETFFLDFVTDDLTTPDTATQAESIAKQRAAGVLTANEARALKNLPPLPGGDTLSNPYTQTSRRAPPAEDRPE